MFVSLMSVVRLLSSFTNPYISAKNKDNDTKPSGYDPWGLPRSPMLSRMTLSSKYSVRNPQHPPSTPHSWPPHSWHASNLDINTKFSGYLPCGKKHHSWYLEWPCHLSLLSGSLNILQVPPFWPSLPDTLLIMISTQNFQGIFLRVKNHHIWH